MSYADRVQLAQFLERHNADETASNLLDGQVSADRDSIALRTYLSVSIGAQLVARAKKVFESLPPDLLQASSLSAHGCDLSLEHRRCQSR